MAAEANEDAPPAKETNPQMIQFIREDWVQKQMRLRTHAFTETVNLRIFAGTWNVAANSPSEPLAAWLACSRILERHEHAPDIFVIGFQEIVDLNASSLLIDHNENVPWEREIERALKANFPEQPYEQVVSKHLVGILLCIYVRSDFAPNVKDVQIDTVGVGIMGVGGNKGGVGARMVVYDSPICFVCSHLAAHQHDVHGRNSDQINIAKRLAFYPNNNPKARAIELTDHDHVFWIGDLNYRLNITDMEAVHAKIAEQDWPYLLSHDQLCVERAAGRAFKGFQEGVVTFGPTYKYQPGTSVYERRPDKKQRIPAWCDRILWTGDDVEQLVYDRLDDLKSSDHKPVHALFNVKAKVLIKEKRDAVHQSLVRQLDTWENECIPKVTMSLNAVQFAGVCYHTPQTRSLLIENTGQVMAQFRFVPKMQEESVCKPWLHMMPEYGIIPPGESIQLALTVDVTSHDQAAAALTSGRDSLEDILIMRLENGRDYFITVAGDYKKSCFGNSLDFLIACPQPVREYDPSRAVAPEFAGRVLSVPKELWRLADWLFRCGIDTPGLFATTGHPQEVAAVREALDTGTEFDAASTSVHSVAETLIRFLDALAAPVFPHTMCAQMMDGGNLTAWCKQALLLLSPPQYNTFVYLLSFLREVLARTAHNQCTPDQVALVFSRCIMHAPTQAPSGKGASVSKHFTVLRHLLTSADFV